MTRRTLIVVAKRPAPGQTKTRLSPPLEPSEAAELYECFLRDTLETVRAARQLIDFKPVIAYLPQSTEDYFRKLAPGFDLLLQQGSDLSQRLHNATTHYLMNGTEQVVIMDSDSPTLPAANLRDAFIALDYRADVVLGPCDDGGYYLIGLKQPAPDLFLKVTMSTPDVLVDTLAQARLNRLYVGLLPVCYDIDFVQDLNRLTEELKQVPSNVAPHTRAFIEAHPLVSKVGD